LMVATCLNERLAARVLPGCFLTSGMALDSVEAEKACSCE